MRLSWNEVRTRAAAFSEEWRDASYEKGETQSFYNDFFQVFGVRRRNVARYEEHVTKLNDSQGFIDLFWPGVLIVEQKSAGRDLESAYEQAGDYFDAIPDNEKPRYILVSDFQNFELRDLDESQTDSFELKTFPPTWSLLASSWASSVRPFGTRIRSTSRRPNSSESCTMLLIQSVTRRKISNGFL